VRRLSVKSPLAAPASVKPAQGAGPIHVYPDGRFVYVTNRNRGEVELDGRRVFNGGDNSVAVFSIDARTGEPTLIQTIDGRGIHLRTFGLHPSGRPPPPASLLPIPGREGGEDREL